MRRDVRDRRRLCGSEACVPGGTPEVPRCGVRVTGRGTCRRHRDLTARPGARELDRAARTFVAWARSLEMVEHMLRACGRPLGEAVVVGVIQTIPRGGW